MNRRERKQIKKSSKSPDEVEAKLQRQIFGYLRSNVPFTTDLVTKLQFASHGMGTEECIRLSRMLKTNTSITHLNLGKNAIGNDGFVALCEALQVNHTLETLIIGSNPVTAVGFAHLGEALKRNKGLTGLHVANTSTSTAIDDLAFESICNGLRYNEHLQKLLVGDNTVGDNGMLHLLHLMKVNTTLTELSFRNNHIRQDGYKALAACLATNQSLTALDLSRNAVVEPPREFGQSLVVNGHLKSLNLAECGISAEKLEPICTGLRHNTTLVDLNLDDNPIQGGISHIINLLQVKSFHTLHLKTVGLKEVEGTALCVALKTARVQRLDLRGNNFQSLSGQLLYDALVANQWLTYLYIRNAQLKDDAVRLMLEALKVNHTLSLLHIWSSTVTLEEIADSLAQNQSLTEVHLAYTSPTHEQLAEFVKNISKNKALIKITGIQCTRGIPLLTKLLRRNKHEQREKRKNTMMIIYNIARSQNAFNLFPPEVWLLILRHVRYPGIGGFDLVAREIFKNPFRVIVRARREDSIIGEIELDPETYNQ